MAAVAMADRVVEVLCDRGPSADPQWTVGSGLLVGGTKVLTAAHAVEGGVLTVRTVGKVEYPAEVALVSSTDTVDLAVLDVPHGLPPLPGLEFARVARSLPAAHVLQDSWAVGFPAFQAVVDCEQVEVRNTAQVDGELPLADDLGSGMLSLLVTRSPRPLPRRDEELGNSSWSGMSGAAVFVANRIVGVITEHSPRRGEQTLTVTPITFVDQLNDAADWWSALGVDPARIVSLPDRPDLSAYAELLEATLDQDPWTRAASTEGRPLSLSGIARPAALRVLRRAGTGGAPAAFDPTETTAEGWSRLVVLGGPGSGKSWLARRLTIHAAQQARRALEAGADPDDVELPLYAPTADVAAAGSPWSAVVEAGLSRDPGLAGSCCRDRFQTRPRREHAAAVGSFLRWKFKVSKPREELIRMALPALTPSRDVASWDPFRELDELANRVNSLWERGFGGRLERWAPLADVEEHDDAYTIEMELPGVRRDDVDIELLDRTLTVSGEVKEKERMGVLHRRTRRVGRFHYAVTLPGDVEPEGVEASLREGVLTIRVPKSADAEPRRIAIAS